MGGNYYICEKRKTILKIKQNSYFKEIEFKIKKITNVYS